MTAAALGMVFGAAWWLIWQAWRPRPEPLAAALARLDTSAKAPVATVTEIEPSWDVRLGAWAIQNIGPLARALQRARADLRIIGRAPEEQAGRSLVYGGFGFLLGPWLGLASWMAGATPSPTVLGTVSLVGALGGAASPWLSVRDEAIAQRRDFLLALTAFCDSASMCLAAGRGIDQAVTTAAGGGEGFAFAEIRGALRAARARNTTPWAALDQLGEELAISDLRELAQTITLAGEDGIAIREAISTKAATIRERLSSDMERAAEAATAKMGMPTFIVGLGFLVFITYPAVAAFSNGF